MGKFKIVNELDKEKWADFIKTNVNGNIFQSPEMYEVYKKTKNYEPIFVAVKDESDNILGILLAVIQRDLSGLFGKLTSRSIIFGGPVIKQENNYVLELIIQEYNKLIRKKAIYSQFRNFWVQGYEKNVYHIFNFDYEEHLNILIDLTIGEERLWKNLKKSRKEGVRKALRNNLKFSSTNSRKMIPIFYNLLKETYNNAKLPHPSIDFFYSLHDSLSEKKIKYFVLKKDDEVFIVLVAFIFKGHISAFYIGINRDKDFFKMRPVDLFYWEVIKWGSENNCTVFDWLGAGKPNKEYGVRKFKLEYGGNMMEFGRYEKVHKPFLYFIARNGLKIWQKIKFKRG